MNKEFFRQEIDHIEFQIKTIEELDRVNSRLQKSNWIFLHPYSQGGDIDILKRLSNQSENADKEILRFFAQKFLDLPITIEFIEGFYVTRPFLKDYVPTIRESVVLCLQKDFKGAINILIPVIEGTLRKHLISKEGEHNKKEINIKKLLRALDSLADDYVELEKKYLLNRHEISFKGSLYLDNNQEKHILKKHRYYFELWIKQFRNFIENNLYLNTKDNDISDKLNRHLIFHSLEDNINYSFSNFLRLFNSLNFLSWAIGSVTKECSILSTATQEDIKNKWADYLNILITSEAITEYKNNIYSEQIESFDKYLDSRQIEAMKRSVRKIKSVLTLNDFLRTK